MMTHLFARTPGARRTVRSRNEDVTVVNMTSQSTKTMMMIIMVMSEEAWTMATQVSKIPNVIVTCVPKPCARRKRADVAKSYVPSSPGHAQVGGLL